jgi:hypothetical protein
MDYGHGNELDLRGNVDELPNLARQSIHRLADRRGLNLGELSRRKGRFIDDEKSCHAFDKSVAHFDDFFAMLP